MLKVWVEHNGYGYGAYYIHYARRKAAFARRRDEFEQKLKKFINRCHLFGITDIVIERRPSFYCGLSAELGNVYARLLLKNNIPAEYREEFFERMGWPKVLEKQKKN